MAAETYSQEVVVLAKTKLKESDLILRMLASDGSLVEAVAKGARKPSSAASARLELFNRADLLLVRGRSLDVVKESRLVSSWPLLHTDPAYGAAAGVVAELMAKIAQPGLAVPALFGLTARSLEAIADASPEALCKLVGATLLKASAMAGVRPSLSECIFCGSLVEASGGGEVWFSMTDGGVVCDGCRGRADAESLCATTLAWAIHLMHSRFDEIESADDDAALGQDVLQLSLRWVMTQLGIRPKSATALVQYCAASPVHV